MGRGRSGAWLKYGCLTTGGLAVAVVLVVGAAVGVALRQNRSSAFESRSFVADSPRDGEQGPPARTRLELRAHTAGVSVKPLPGGASIRIGADYDPRRHQLDVGTERDGDTEVVTVDLRPRGSNLMALLRLKLGGDPPRLRIEVPRDVRLDIDGRLQRSYAALELGGLSLVSSRLEVEDGGVKLSFVRPLVEPMERLTLSGRRSSISVTGVGNASPRQTRVLQHIGAVDLDLRGSWKGDASVWVLGGAAGGTLWLPDNVRVVGVDDPRIVRSRGNPEVALPTVQLTIDEHLGRFVVME